MEAIFRKVHTAKDLVISTLILAAGIGLYFVNHGLGIVLALIGLLMLLLYKGGYKREGEDILLKKKAMDVAHSCRDSLKGFLDGKDVEPVVDTTAIGGIIRLEVYYNESEQIAYAQLFDFSDYVYQPATELVALNGQRAQKLISKL